MDEDVLCGWTIYANTSDFPDHYAVRMWWVEEEGLAHHPMVVLCGTLEEAREQIPAGAIVSRVTTMTPLSVKHGFRRYHGAKPREQLLNFIAPTVRDTSRPWEG